MAEVLAAGRAREAKEAGFFEALRAGSTTVELLGLDASLVRQRSRRRVPSRWHNAGMSDDTTKTTTTRADGGGSGPSRPMPGRIFAVLSDPKGHVDIDSSGMLMDCTGEPATKAGDEFVIHMDREALNDYPMGLTTSRSTSRPSSRIARSPGPFEGQINRRSATSTATRSSRPMRGTLVTSYYDWSTIDPQWKEANIFPVIPESALRATLGILERTLNHSTQW